MLADGGNRRASSGLPRKIETGDIRRKEGEVFAKREKEERGKGGSRKQVEGSSLGDSGMAIMSTPHSVFFFYFSSLGVVDLRHGLMGIVNIFALLCLFSVFSLK